MSNVFVYLTRGTTGRVPVLDGVGAPVDYIKSQGLKIDADGNVYANTGAVIDHYHQALPFDVNGRLVISTSPVAYVDQGIPFTAAGEVSGDNLPELTAGEYVDQGLYYSSIGQLGLLGAGGGTAKDWTPNFNGLTVFGSLFNAWSPTGANSTLIATFYYKSNGLAQQLLDKAASVFSLDISAADVISFNLLSNVELNEVSVISGVTVLPEGYNTLTADIDGTADIQFIGATV